MFYFYRTLASIRDTNPYPVHLFFYHNKCQYLCVFIITSFIIFQLQFIQSQAFFLHQIMRLLFNYWVTQRFFSTLYFRYFYLIGRISTFTRDTIVAIMCLLITNFSKNSGYFFCVFWRIYVVLDPQNYLKFIDF